MRACPVCSKPMLGYHNGNSRMCRTCSVATFPIQIRALGAVTRAVASGALPRPSTMPCADCGGLASCYEHRDYTKPLEVVPICRRCNQARGQAYPRTPGSIQHIDLDALEAA